MERFYKIAKLSIVAFIIALLMVAFYGCTATDVEEVELPLVLGIYFLVSAIVFVICILIGMVLDFIENIGRDRGYPVQYILMVVLCWLAIVVVDYYPNWDSIDWLGSLTSAVGVVGIMKTMLFIFKKKTYGNKKIATAEGMEERYQ